ncbi:MAG: hypothetical protein R3252_11640 [Robiginitalea sp.]|nr:hypothetical protein [Robiginitalea sp.]
MDREELKVKASELIDDAASKIDALKQKKEAAKARVEAEYEEAIGKLKAKKMEIEAQIDRMEDAAEDEWEDIKKTFSDASDSFREGFQKLGHLFD